MTAAHGSRARVFVGRTLPGAEALARLQAAADIDVWDAPQPPSSADIVARSAACDAILAMLTMRIDGALLDACPRVRVISNLAVGYDNIDVPAATARGVLVTNTPDVLTETTADLAFALLLGAARHIAEGDRAVRAGQWGPWAPTTMLGRDVHGATLGIVGPGRIGRAVAQRGLGFGMRVLYHGHRAVPDFPGTHVGMEELLSHADFVSVHVPLTDETRGMFGAAQFTRMQPHAIFVNTTRGAVVDQDALRAALIDGVIGGAALDVTTPEPLPPDDPLLQSPNLLVTPHIGSATEQTRAQMAMLAVDAVIDTLAGRRPAHLVNPEAWDHRR